MVTNGEGASDLANEVHDNEVEDDMGEDEVSKGSLRTDAGKLRLVGRIDLETLMLKANSNFLLFSYLESETNSKHKRCHTGDKAREECIEGKCSHEAAVHKLDNTSEEDIGQVGVNDLQLLGRVGVVFFIELAKDSGKGRHVSALE